MPSASLLFGLTKNFFHFSIFAIEERTERELSDHKKMIYDVNKCCVRKNREKNWAINYVSDAEEKKSNLGTFDGKEFSNFP